MSESLKIAFMIYIFVSVTVIIVLSVLISEKNKESFKQCICSSNEGGRAQNCQDIATVNNLYVTGQLTENSALPNKGWSSTNPGDIEFPKSEGCSFSNQSRQDIGKWKTWDFTDFGN